MLVTTNMSTLRDTKEKTMKRVPLTEQEINEMMASEPKTLVLKCKPVYNYQSIEFEYEIKNGDDFANMFELYKQLVDGLMMVAPEQPDARKPIRVKEPVKKPEPPKEEPATEAQIRIMKDFNVKYPKNCTKKQARDLISASIKKAKEEQEEWKSELWSGSTAEE